MADRRFSEVFEDLNDRVDRAAMRLYPRMDSIRSVPDRDLRLTRMFPYFIALCIIIWICALLYLQDFRFSKIVEILCLVFVACFALLGVPCLVMMDRGVFSNWILFALALVMTGFMWLSGIYLGQVYYAQAIQDIMNALGFYLDDYMQFVLGFGGTLAIVYFTSIGVLSVVCAYMRQYVARVFLQMDARAGTGERGKAESFFMVPDIIDVKEVVLEPEKDPHSFHFSLSASVTAYLFVLGLFISSYLFVNPLLISVMGWRTMLAVTLMLSMFTPALVIPWQVVRSVGAKVKSDAPRDYYLWTGARKRLFSAFAALGVFMMMFILSVYLGNSVSGIIMTYISFLVPLLATSIVYGALYANNFDSSVCESICENFEEGKEGRGSPRGPSTLIVRGKGGK